MEDRIVDWVSGVGKKAHRSYLKPVPWCEPCYEREVEKQELMDLEAWPDLHETLQEGLDLILEDDPWYSEWACPEGRGMMMVGEVTKW